MIRVTLCYQILHGNGAAQWARRTNEKHILSQQIFLHDPAKVLSNCLWHGFCHCTKHTMSV